MNEQSSCFFVKTESLINQLTVSGILVNEMFVPVTQLSAPATKIMISIVPPFNSNDVIMKELQRFGKIASPVKEISLFYGGGGDINCTLDFSQIRNSEEPHAQSALCLATVIKNLNLFDVWREHNLLSRQYTWVKIINERVSAARLDRLYTSCNLRNRALNSTIFSTSISDHKFVIIECTLIQ